MLCHTCLVSRYSARPASPELAADPRLLVAAPLRLRHVRVVVVDPDGAHPHPSRDPLRLPGVLGPDRAGQPVGAVVGEGHRVVLGAEGLDGENRPERLVLGHRHAAGAAVENRRQVVEAVGQGRVVGSSAAAPEDCSLGEAGRDVGRHLVAVPRADQRSGLGLLVVRTAEPDHLRTLHECVDEPVVQGLLDEQAGTCGADLSGVQEHGGERVVQGDRDVGIGEDDVRVLASELQSDPLHGRRGGCHDRRGRSAHRR